jgi:hypothetical protein
MARLTDIPDRIGLARLLRLAVAGSIPPLWAEIALLHFRGSFQSRFMWIPVAGLPTVFLGGTASTLMGDERAARALFRPLAWLLVVIGAGGTFFHLRGIGRQMGGFRNWKYNAVTGPPLPAPPQVALLGLLGVAASSPPTASEPAEQDSLVRWARAINAISYALLGTEAGYNHWIGGYGNKVMYTPVVLSPMLMLAHLAVLAGVKGVRKAELALSTLAAVGGLVGFTFHLRNIRRRSGGFSWQNLFYGPPAVAPLQLSGQGILGLLAALYGRAK